MKLYLCSYRIPAPDKLWDLVGKQPTEIKAALIPNAKDYYADRARAVKIRQVREYLDGLGMQVEIFDLREYYHEKDIENELKDFDLLWVMGGNTFCLRHEMRRSHFDLAIRPLLDRGLVYAGESAGAVAAGTSLQGIEIADNPEFAESVIYEGLNLVPYFVLPHVDNEDFAQDVIESRRIHENPKTRLELKDSDTAIFIDGSMTITGTNGNHGA